MADKSEPSKSNPKRVRAGFEASVEKKLKNGGYTQPQSDLPPLAYTGSMAEQEKIVFNQVKAPAPSDSIERFNIMAEKVRLQEQKNAMIYGLPHRYGWKWYPWAREFFESRNKLNFLCAANQISKSSTQIRKCIEWATNKELWPQLWDREPNLFWYLYPEKSVATAEFKHKWEKEFLPRGEFKDHPVYGWKAFYKRGDIDYIEFNSGVSVYFKTYSQDVEHLQTGTVYAIFCDEELPEEHYSELGARLNATDGYFSMVFTATLGQDFWRRCMEPDDGEEEEFPQAHKQVISLYEAMFYEDGTPSHWSAEKIAGVKAKCKTHDEVQKRVYGHFIILIGRKFPAFDSTRHMKPPHHLPPSWSVYEGVDPGSGGEKGHPAAICFVAVAPDFRSGRVFLGWRGDKIETTNGFLVKKHIEMKKENNLNPTMQFYDHANKDFEMTARGMEETFLKAEKGHDFGEGLINTLFENDMIFLYETEDGEISKLARELSTLKIGKSKKHAKDDFTDAFRYAISKIPWDLSGIIGKQSEFMEPAPEETDPQKLQDLDRRGLLGVYKEEESSLEDEFEEWNEFYG